MLAFADDIVETGLRDLPSHRCRQTGVHLVPLDWWSNSRAKDSAVMIKQIWLQLSSFNSDGLDRLTILIYNHLPKLTQPSIHAGQINQVLTCLAGLWQTNSPASGRRLPQANTAWSHVAVHASWLGSTQKLNHSTYDLAMSQLHISQTKPGRCLKIKIKLSKKANKQSKCWNDLMT